MVSCTAGIRWSPTVPCSAAPRGPGPGPATPSARRRTAGGVDEALAARHALAGQAPQLAAEIIAGHWLDALLRGDAAVLEEVCLQLPAPWSDDPEILTIRATCRTAPTTPIGPLRCAAGPTPWPATAIRRSGHARTDVLLSDLLVADDAAELLRSCQRVRGCWTVRGRCRPRSVPAPGSWSASRRSGCGGRGRPSRPFAMPPRRRAPRDSAASPVGRPRTSPSRWPSSVISPARRALAAVDR